MDTPYQAVRLLALLLLVLRVLADDHNLALAANDLALFADRLYRRSYLHDILPPSMCWEPVGSVVGGMGHRQSGDHWRSGHIRASARFIIGNRHAVSIKSASLELVFGYRGLLKSPISKFTCFAR